MNGQNPTKIIREQLSHCDEIETFKKSILPILQSESAAWKDKIQSIISINGYSKAEMAALCGVSRTAVSKWCSGSLPSSRDDYIRVGFAAHYGLDEMNTFLQRYGKYPALYSRSLEDSVYIFVLNSSLFPHTYKFCCDTLTRVKECMQTAGNAKENVFSTVQLDHHLSQLETVEELEKFVRENSSAFRTPYAKLYAYIKAFIVSNNIDYATNKALSVDSLATVQNWTSSMRQCVSAIRQGKWFPLRRKVIALGLHLNMTTDQINEMLCLARMEALCPKNLVESAVIFAVDDADLNGLICCDGGTELCDHVHQVLKELDISEAEKLLNDI